MGSTKRHKKLTLIDSGFQEKSGGAISGMYPSQNWATSFLWRG